MKKIKKILFVIGGLLILLLIYFFIPESKKVLETNHFMFIYSSSIVSGKINLLANALEGNYEKIGNDLETTPSSKIEVNIYSQRWRYIKATKNWGGSGNIEGASKLHFVEQAWSEIDNKKVAVHEFTHTVTLKLLLDMEPQPFNFKNFDVKFSTFPTWIWEGISLYEAEQFVDPKTLPYLTNGRYPKITELNNRLNGGKIYTCGYTIIEYILSKYGQDKLILLIKNYGNLQTTFDITDDQFCKEWQKFIAEKYLQKTPSKK